MISQSIPQANEDHARRERADYGFARLRDQMFDAVTALWRRRQKEVLAQIDLAHRIGRDPAWVSRSLAAPGNWTLRTAGELIAALEGEAEIRVAALEDPLESRPNYDAYDGYLPGGGLSAVQVSRVDIPVPIAGFPPSFSLARILVSYPGAR